VATGAAVRYTRTAGGGRIAFRASGSGPALLAIGGFGALFSIDSATEQPRWSRFEALLESFSTLICFDLAGIGLSDPQSGAFDVGSWAEDALAVLDAAEVDEAVVLGCGYGGLVALRLAASRPPRVRGLILANAFARIARADDYPAGVPAAVLAQQVSDVAESDVAEGGDIDVMAPSLAHEPDTRAWWAKASSRAAGPATAARFWELLSSCDERAVVPSVAAETLVLQTSENRSARSGHARWLVDHLPRARLVMVPGADHIAWAHPGLDLVAEIEEFVTGVRAQSARQRHVAGILFTDLVASTDSNARSGDASWANTLARHDALCSTEVKRFGGRVVKTMGDGVLATFPNLTSGVRAGTSIVAVGKAAGFSIRAGLHAAEIETMGDDVFGIGVAIASRTLTHAEADALTVTRTVVDLMVGSGTEFETKGSFTLKGVPGEWELFVASSTAQ
jgi:pimeloyl-ACP methyl ester carboxylesterase